MRFDEGYISGYFVRPTGASRGWSWRTCILFGGQLKVSLSGSAAAARRSSGGKPLLIIAGTIGARHCHLVINKIRGTFGPVAVCRLQPSATAKAMPQDIAILTGGR